MTTWTPKMVLRKEAYNEPHTWVRVEPVERLRYDESLLGVIYHASDDLTKYQPLLLLLTRFHTLEYRVPFL